MSDNTVGGGERVTASNTYSRAKLKLSVFENGQFSGHLPIFDKNNCFWRKKLFYSEKQKPCFF